MKLLNKKGIINLGGPTKTVYDFAKKYNPKIIKISAKKLLHAQSIKTRYSKGSIDEIAAAIILQSIMIAAALSW